MSHGDQATRVAERVGAAWHIQAVRALLFASLIGLGAILRIPLRPVPVTMQVFFVLLSGLSLGPTWGSICVLAYLAMGLSGAPFFAAPPHAGPIVLAGPTGGYLVGFIPGVFVTGTVFRYLSSRSPKGYWGDLMKALISSAAGLAAIYLMGWSWLAIWLGFHGSDPAAAFRLGVRPFILIDLGKALLASLALLGLPGRLRHEGGG